ncbi:ankyrin repeat domain-containing protein [Aurantiacibacter sp. MUD11]|uniref:ankyrin repeat domain-containing protein n=1 Tax=Aurantiacibacter sp. MUD11 TaxID=3003265 RepID=UPI0022AA44D7|nr:ankyrin repeat domain-containing protein [Aurantiacibacter sp. MUD11]WAT17590.1 ankyrin repeat domain-containing protein [Aurantiacibacter sp. MUD11]
MARVTFRNIVFTAAALALAAPAAAQFYSDGYLFLEAVKDREGDEATELLNKPGSTVINARDLTSGETGLHITVARRDITWTNFLLQEGANPNIADNSGRTPLIAAAQVGFVEGVRSLIAHGARVDVANRTGETPLIFAVLSGNLDLIEVLVTNGADPDRADNTGRSAREYASQPGVSSRVLAAIENNESDANSGGDRIYGPVF